METSLCTSIFSECQPVSNDARWLYWRIANLLHEQAANRGQTAMRWRLGGQYIDYLDLPDSFPVPVAFDADLTALIRSAAGSEWGVRPRVVILLDEIEKILPTTLGNVEFTGFFDFLSYLARFRTGNPRFGYCCNWSESVNY